MTAPTDTATPQNSAAESGSDQRLVRRCGKCSANEFIARMEKSQRVRLQKTMWKLCDENRQLGGTQWKNVLRQFGLKESDVWPSSLNDQAQARHE